MNRNQGVACSRDPLVDAIARFLARDHALGLNDIRASLARTIDDAGPTAIDGLGTRLASAGSDWSYYPRDPLARDIHRVLAGRVLQHDPVVRGIEHLDRVRGQRVVIFANHLSYSDANAIDVLLQGSGGAELADRLTVVAGPKVYSNLRRRFSSLCFGTIKVPQTSARASGCVWARRCWCFPRARAAGQVRCNGCCPVPHATWRCPTPGCCRWAWSGPRASFQ
jgi:hypothetical protein